MRTITNMLRVESKAATEWPNKIWKIQLILNTTKRKTTGCSPFKVVLGQEEQTPQIRSILADLPVGELNRTPANRADTLNKLNANATKQLTRLDLRKRCFF